MLFCRNPSLEFVAAPPLKPAEVEIDPAQMQQYEKELAEAAAAPLPDEVCHSAEILTSPADFANFTG